MNIWAQIDCMLLGVLNLSYEGAIMWLEKITDDKEHAPRVQSTDEKNLFSLTQHTRERDLIGIFFLLLLDASIVVAAPAE